MNEVNLEKGKTKLCIKALRRKTSVTNTERREDWHKTRLGQDRKALNDPGLYSKIHGKPRNGLKWGDDVVPSGFLRGN